MAKKELTPEERNRYYSPEEISKIYEDADAADARGDDDEKNRLEMLVPISPCVAKVSKDIYGKEFVSQFNLFRANEQYGEGWMEREDTFGPDWVK